jgi:hypothetical protein
VILEPKTWKLDRLLNLTVLNHKSQIKNPQWFSVLSVVNRLRFFGSFYMGAERPGLDFPRAFDLHEDVVVARLWKAVRERHFG